MAKNFLSRIFGGRDPRADTRAESGAVKTELPFHNDPPRASSISEPEDDLPKLPPEIEENIRRLPESKQNTALRKAKTWKDAIQPHTDESTHSHWIGDIYEEINQDCARQWSENVNPGPYLRFLQHISKRHKHIEYLVHWMLVGCAPPKWPHLKNFPESRAERVQRTNVCIVEYRTGQPPASTSFASTERLQEALCAFDNSREKPEVRLIIAEDLSRDLVDVLGAHYDVDPLFFLSHIGDYLFHNTRDRWVELPDLDIDARKRTHFSLQYLRPRYFKNEEEFETAEQQSGMFNVLRRLDSDRSRKSLQNSLLDLPEASVTLTRAKASMWIKPAKSGEHITAILLVDPTVTAGKPIWNIGYRPFEESPSIRDFERNEDFEVDGPPRSSLFDDVVYYSKRVNDKDLEKIKKDAKCIALPMLKLVAADWLAVLKYMTTMFGLIDWSFAKPHWGASPDDIADVLKRIAPWRRNVGYYQGMVHDSIARLFPAIAAAFPSTPANLTVNVPSDSGIYELWADFKNIKHQMDEHKGRIASIQTMATNAINTEEARRAVKQNKNLARLTFLATFFIPLNFTSSFLSMSPDFANADQTIWLFFVLGIPVTIFAFILVDMTKPDRRGKIWKWWGRAKKWWKGKNSSQSKSGSQSVQRRTPSPQPNTTRSFTGAWPYNRANSSWFGK